MGLCCKGHAFSLHYYQKPTLCWLSVYKAPFQLRKFGVPHKVFPVPFLSLGLIAHHLCQTHKTTEQPMRIHSVIVLSLKHCLSWIPTQFQWEWSSKHDWIRTCWFLLHLSPEAFQRLPIPSVVIYYPITIISAPSCTIMLKWPIFCPSVQLNILNSACRAHQVLQRC